MAIPFTQYPLIDGISKQMFCNADEETERKAWAVIDSGLEFEAEVLSTGYVSLTVFDPVKEEDVAIEVVANGPPVVEAVKRLVHRAYDLIQKGEADARSDA